MIHELIRTIQTFVAEYPERFGVTGWWRQPIAVTARADERFDALTEIVQPEHARPADILAGARSVIVYFLPFKKELAEGNLRGPMASRDWGLAYVETNTLIGRLNDHLKAHLSALGYRSAVTPATHNFDQVKLMSRWSHKHLAHLAGLGRFGLHRQIITPEGACGRLGSLVTDADLEDNPLIEPGEELCLHKSGRKCLACVRKCPVGALTETGFDRHRCYAHLLANDAALSDLPLTDVCGKCVALTPCSFRGPDCRDARSDIAR